MIRTLTILLCLFLFACQGNKTTPEKLLAPEAFLSACKTSKGILIDVRTPEEYQNGSIDGSLNIDYKANNFSERLNALDKKQPLYLFCRSGRRSAASLKIAEELGFNKVYDMKGGYLAYIDQ